MAGLNYTESVVDLLQMALIVQLQRFTKFVLIYKIICDKLSIPGMTHYGLAYAHHLRGTVLQTNIYMFSLQIHEKMTMAQ